MIKLNIEAYACNNDHYEHAEKYIADRVDLYRELEEALYILYELEPKDKCPEWCKAIWTDEGTMFTYAGIDACVVTIHKNSEYTFTVEARDI